MTKDQKLAAIVEGLTEKVARLEFTNADLIAAYDAFEAAQRVVDECAECQTTGRVCATHIEEGLRVRDLRRAAVAKAKGERS